MQSFATPLTSDAITCFDGSVRKGRAEGANAVTGFMHGLTNGAVQTSRPISGFVDVNGRIVLLGWVREYCERMPLIL